MFNESRCYRPDEIAEILGIDKSTVYRLINAIDDPIPAYRPSGTHLRVNGGDLNKWLERRRVKPEEE
mgnify:CR=1 FL=1